MKPTGAVRPLRHPKRKAAEKLSLFTREFQPEHSETKYGIITNLIVMKNHSIHRKKILIFSSLFSVAICAISFFGCQKDTEKDLSVSTPNELQILYNQLSIPNFGTISVIGNDILCFSSFHHYEDVCNKLRQLCNEWDNLFLTTNSTLSDIQLQNKEDSLEYNEFLPLIEFENNYNVLGLMLRDLQESLVNSWMDRNFSGEDPTDPMIIDEIEQTLFNSHREICIGDTIYQLRTNGIVKIPTDSLNNLTTYRTLSLQELALVFPVKYLSTKPSTSVIYFPSDWNDDFYDSSTEKSIWYVRGEEPWYQHSGSTHSKIISKIVNYKYNDRTGSWKKTRKMCDITTKAKFYQEEISSNGVINQQTTLNHSNLPLQEKNKYSRRDVVKVSFSQPCNSCVYNYGIQHPASVFISTNNNIQEIVLPIQ